jgi:hypothetical protein
VNFLLEKSIPDEIFFEKIHDFFVKSFFGHTELEKLLQKLKCHRLVRDLQDLEGVLRHLFADKELGRTAAQDLHQTFCVLDIGPSDVVNEL